MTIIKKHKLIFDISVEAKKFKEETGEYPLWNSYEGRDKPVTRIQSPLEEIMKKACMNRHQRIEDFKYKVLDEDSDKLIVRVTFKSINIEYPDVRKLWEAQ